MLVLATTQPKGDSMKALVYNGPRDVTVKEVEDPRIERPTDVLTRITRTNSCGSDLHMYEGRTDMESGRVLGHENMGEVVEVGSGIDRLNVGDMVAVPFNVACGHCKNCERGSPTTASPLSHMKDGLGPRMALPIWGRMTAARRSTSACRGVTSTASGCLKTPGRSRTTM
jgi:threonine dehydrogenase-like Zn-dependent dehydrogenase